MKKTVKTICFILVFGLVFSYSATAGDAKKIGVAAFISYYNTGSSNLGDVDAHFDTVPSLGVSLTYFITKAFSVELSAQQVQTDLTLEHDGKRGKLGEIKQTPILLTGRFNRRIPKTRLNLYLGIGAGYYANSFDQEKEKDFSDFFGLNIKADVKESYGFHANAGTEMFFTKNLSVYLDLKALFTQAKFDIVYPDNSSDDKDVSMNASVLGTGVKYYF
jgi:outer membrane protein W